MNTQKQTKTFSLGQIVATPGVLAAVPPGRMASAPFFLATEIVTAV